jgi:NDP-sugar pyrophosphorylase family protein
MMAIILAGGKGTRLKPFTMTIPKPLLPVGDIPIIEVILRQLASVGVSRVVVTLGHMAHLFLASIGDGSRFGLRIEYCTEEEPLGTAGSVRLVKDLEDEVLVMNGDVLTTLDYQEFFNMHREKKAWASAALHKREVKIDYGVVEATSDGFLSKYIEKPTIDYEVSMGINILSAKCVQFIPALGKFDMPELLIALHSVGKTVACYRTDCYWQDIGRFDDYQQASADFVTNPTLFIPEH